MSEAVQELAPLGMIALRADLTVKPVQSALGDTTGLEIPAPLRYTGQDALRLLWMSPDEALILSAPDAVKPLMNDLSDALGKTHNMITDLSAARVGFRLSGPDARVSLAKLTPVDLHPTKFGPGQVRRTRLGQIAAVFWMTDPETFEIFCFRSYGSYLHALLNTAVEGPGIV